MTRAGIASVLLLPLNNTPNVNGIMPGKLFEYLALNKPIFCIGPEEGDSATIIKECNAGIVAGFDDKEKVKSGILNLYRNYITGTTPYAEKAEIKNKYSRKELTESMVELLNEMIN